MKTLLVMLAIGVCSSSAQAGTSGKSDYNAYCAGCHGANANVHTEKARALKMDVRKLSLKVSMMSRGQMIAIVENGKGEMPDFKKQLSKKRIRAVVDYIRSLRKI